MEKTPVFHWYDKKGRFIRRGIGEEGLKELLKYMEVNVTVSMMIGKTWEEALKDFGTIVKAEELNYRY